MGGALREDKLYQIHLEFSRLDENMESLTWQTDESLKLELHIMVMHTF